jgi:hypothetical protein
VFDIGPCFAGRVIVSLCRFMKRLFEVIGFGIVYDINILLTLTFINQPNIFGSIVVSISACHSKDQLAGGRGSIPRQRVSFFAFLVLWQVQSFARATLFLCLSTAGRATSSLSPATHN